MSSIEQTFDAQRKLEEAQRQLEEAQRQLEKQQAEVQRQFEEKAKENEKFLTDLLQILRHSSAYEKNIKSFDKYPDLAARYFGVMYHKMNQDTRSGFYSTDETNKGYISNLIEENKKLLQNAIASLKRGLYKNETLNYQRLLDEFCSKTTITNIKAYIAKREAEIEKLNVEKIKEEENKKIIREALKPRVESAQPILSKIEELMTQLYRWRVAQLTDPTEVQPADKIDPIEVSKVIDDLHQLTESFNDLVN